MEDISLVPNHKREQSRKHTVLIIMGFNQGLHRPVSVVFKSQLSDQGKEAHSLFGNQWSVGHHEEMSRSDLRELD